MSAGVHAGFVLAGGRSSRMGTDKALLPFGGETLLERTARLVYQAAGRATIVGDPARYAKFGYPVIPDHFPGSGPLAGIHAALSFTTAEWNLVVACDMPGLHTEALGALLERTGQFPDTAVLLPEHGGRPQPLCAVYHQSALPAIERALRASQRKIMDALVPLRIARFEAVDFALFRNVNTPEDWSALLEQ